MNKVFHTSEAASLAMHSMILLAGAALDRGLNVREIAAQTGASEAHLAKVLQRLAKAGLLRSSRGPAGGFSLALPAEAITLLTILEAIEGPTQPSGCLLRRQDCLFSKCLFNGLLEKLSAEFTDYLAGITLAEFIKV